jgi:protein TonB
MMAIRKGIKESYVIFDFDISVNGEPTNIRLKEAYPSDIFVSNAEKALKQTKYEPRLENGMPIETTCANVQFDYTISDKVIRM